MPRGRATYAGHEARHVVDSALPERCRAQHGQRAGQTAQRQLAACIVLVRDVLGAIKVHGHDQGAGRGLFERGSRHHQLRRRVLADDLAVVHGHAMDVAVRRAGRQGDGKR